MEAEEAGSCWRNKRKIKGVECVEQWCDVEAAQQLLELSDEEKKSNKKKKRRRSSSGIVMAKIQEIFGKEINEAVFPSTKKKQRRYRSLVNIYMATTPIVTTTY